MTQNKILKLLISNLFVLAIILPVVAQNSGPLTLQQAIDMALEKNHLLNIKKIQVEEKASKVTENKIKAFPSVSLNSTWQYNQNLSQLAIPKGSFGSIPLNPQLVIPLPSQDLAFELSKHEIFSAGVMLYQPITQLAKIKVGVDVSKTDVNIAQQEQIKASLQIEQAVEKLYYGLLINQKQKEEATAKLELAKMKLHDVESAILSGKTIDVNRAGLMANIADEEQNLLKIQIQAEDYIADFKTLTGLADDDFTLVEAETLVPTSLIASLQGSTTENRNAELIIAELNQKKAKQGVKAARWSYLPDLGFVAGYTYQRGSTLYPENNPYVGANFKWNFQDIFLNRQLVNQRNFVFEQAAENLENTRQQVSNDIEKAKRKINQAIALINVAQKAVTYREEELKIQQDKEASGLNTAAELLNTKSLLAKARADLLAEQLNYRIAQTDLRILKGE